MKKVILLIVALLLSLPNMYAQYTGCADGTEDPAVENASFEQTIFDLVNAERAKQGAPALVRSEQLDRASRYHAEDMAEEGYFHHDSYDGSTAPNGCTAGSNGGTQQCGRGARIKKFYLGTGVGTEETLGAGWSNPDSVVLGANGTGWISSGSHSGIMLNPVWQEGGVGYYKKDNDNFCTHYWVMNFGKRDSIVNTVNTVEAPRFVMSSPQPNPFNQTANVSLTVEQTQEVSIQVVNLLGQPVQQIYNGTILAGQSHQFVIDGSSLAQGVYMYHVKGADFETVKKIVVQK